MVTNDDKYRGHRIPGQAMLIANIWCVFIVVCVAASAALSDVVMHRGMSQDETLYPNPQEFLPDRYINRTVSPDKVDLLDPKNIVFGFGRRYVSFSFEC